MSDSSGVITKALQEHHDIREHVKLAGDSVNDIDALITLQTGTVRMDSEFG